MNGHEQTGGAFNYRGGLAVCNLIERYLSRSPAVNTAVIGSRPHRSIARLTQAKGAIGKQAVFPSEIRDLSVPNSRQTPGQVTGPDP
jgi:hypothetical protein